MRFEESVLLSCPAQILFCSAQSPSLCGCILHPSEKRAAAIVVVDIMVELIGLAAGSACSSACTQHIRNDDIDASIRTVPGPAATMVRMSWD